MRKLFSIFALLSLATGFVACETTEQTEDNKEYNVELTADKTAIVADGSDAATFTVKQYRVRKVSARGD